MAMTVFSRGNFAVGYNALMYSIGINYVSKKKREKISKTILLKPFYIAIVIMFVLVDSV